MRDILKTLADQIKSNFSPQLLILALLFTALYFPQTLMMNESLETIAAFEIDASLMIQTVFEHLENYNLRAGYMTRSYGWSFTFINFILLKPIDLISVGLGQNFSVTFKIFLIKAVFFSISFSSLMALYILLKKIFNSNILAFSLSLLYLFPPMKSTLFVDVKPETTGLLFLFLAQISLVHFIKDRKSNMRFWYILGLLFSTLSILTKQSFVFVIIPIVLLFYCYYITRQRLNFFRHPFSKSFLKIFASSLLFSLVIAFIVSPYFFIHPIKFYTSQLRLFHLHGGDGELILKGMDLYKAWVYVIWNDLFLKTLTLLWPISLMVALLNKNILKSFFVVHILTIPIVVLILCKNSGLFISTHYLTPLFSYFLILIGILLSSLTRINHLILKTIAVVACSYLLVIMILFKFFHIHSEMTKRAGYLQSDNMQAKFYIEDNILEHSKIAISHGIPFSNEGEGKHAYCHWWNNCSTADQLENFEPDYFIFIDNLTYNGIYPESYLNFINYIERNNFSRIDSVGRFVIYQRL